jgi:hypothetical protein
VNTSSLNDLADKCPALVAGFNRRWNAYEEAVRRGDRPRLEDVVNGVDGSDYRVLLRHALLMEWELRHRLGHSVALEDYLGRFRDDELVREAFDERETVSRDPVPQTLPDRDDFEMPCIPGYRVVRLLGRGGMGEVYEVETLNPCRRREALKLIRSGSFQPERIERFLAEIPLHAQLQNDHIVRVYHAGTAGDRPYFTMELMEGGSLAGWIDHRPRPAEEAARLLLRICEAVHYLHTQPETVLEGKRTGGPIIHRDLKPANVLLGADGTTPKISDFGLSRYLNAEDRFSRAGTASYMAPEQVAGEALGPCTDVYALGAILYEMLTGKPPFVGASVSETLEQVRTRNPVSPRELNPAVDRTLAYICLKCLEKKPQDRYPSAAKLSADLKTYLTGGRIRDLEPWWRWLWRQLQSPCRIDRPHEWAVVFRVVAAWRVICHGVMALLLLSQWGAEPAAYWAWFLGLHVGGTWLPVRVLRHSEGRLDPTERSVLLNWAATFACDALLLGIFCPLWGQAVPEEVVRVYPAWLAVRGLWYVMEAQRFWGLFYAVGLGYFIAAPLLSLCGLLAPVAYVLVVACAMLLLSYGFQRQAKQQTDARARMSARG